MSVEFVWVRSYLGITETIDFRTLRDNFKILNIPIVSIRRCFFKKQPTDDLELKMLKEQLNYSYDEKHIIAYERVNIKHPTYTYFQFLIMRSGDLFDLKQAFKLEKMKAFI